MRAWRAFYWWKRAHPILAGLAWMFGLWGVSFIPSQLAMWAGVAQDTAMPWGIGLFAIGSIWFVFPAVAAILGFNSAPAHNDPWRNIQAQEAARRWHNQQYGR